MIKYVDLKLSKKSSIIVRDTFPLTFPIPFGGKRIDFDQYDINFIDGDFEKEDGFDTAILISFLAERRASESEVLEPQHRRGWVGNEINGFDNFEYGSKLWLLYQARATQSTLNNAITYVNDAFQWMIEDGYVQNIIVTAEYDENLDLIINIQFVRNNDATITRSFNLWNATFTDGEI